MNVCLCRRVIPHVSIHGRRNKYGSMSREQSGCECVITDTCGYFCNYIGRSRNYQKQIGPVGYINMRRWTLTIVIEVREHWMLRKGTKRCYSHKFLRIGRHNNPYITAIALKRAQNFNSLICGNTPRYRKRYLFLSRSCTYHDRLFSFSEISSGV